MKSLIALVGMKHRGTEALVASLPQGEPLTLIREPNNQFDPNAVQVWARGTHVGYLKSNQVLPVTLAMDRAEQPERVAKLAIDGGKWPMCEVEE
jgi:hypothetical protein